MIWRIEVVGKKGVFDPEAESLKTDIADLDISGVEEIKINHVFWLEGSSLSQEDADRAAKELLIDKITQDYVLSELVPAKSRLSQITADGFRIAPRSAAKQSRSGARDNQTGNPERSERVVEVAQNSGVMDPIEESVKKGARDLGIDSLESVKTAKKYMIKADIADEQIEYISGKLLLNKIIQHVVKDTESVFLSPPDYEFKLTEVDLLSADKEKLDEISKQGQLFLSTEEMSCIKEYYTKTGRNPTDIELETLAQTWSEHCGHKTFRGLIDFNGREIDNLLKNTIVKAEKELNKPWCVSVFKDNAGIITFDDEYNICFKVETHNHPSALDPYGGAGTGIGGVVRDPMGTGLGAKPILNTDVFCFGPPDYSHEDLPAGTLHPKRIMKGVVSGVRDYGNRMGIPTANGAVLFDERYIGNPLVYCGNVGIMPKDKCDKEVKPGDLVVVVGGRTGRDGIHGATFSSGELTEESEDVSSGAVQIGNPITEKKIVDTLIQARDKGLYRAITDCGAGGLSSAVGEMGEETGAEVDLEKVPLKYKGLSYAEIWISEAQERMVLAVDPGKREELLNIFASENVEAIVIGQFTKDKHLRLNYKGTRVCDLDMDFLHNGVPKLKRKAVWTLPKLPESKFKEPQNLTSNLLEILSAWNVCSKEWVIRQYDHEVQGGSILKPLQGAANDGPGDACIVRPRLDSEKGIIVSNGINPKYGVIDPYWMAASAIDEALRQIIAVGGSLEKVALLDNFSWGNTNKPDRLGSLVRAAQACYDMSIIYGTPFISGKDSLNNEYTVKGESISIPPTLLISAIAVMDDVRKAVTMDVKNTGNLIYIVGNTYNEMGGSHYYDLQDLTSSNVPKVDPVKAKKLMDIISQFSSCGLIASCHDCSEGGLAVAAAEMAFAGGYGMDLSLEKVPNKDIARSDILLFSESNTRFIVEISPENKEAFEGDMRVEKIPAGLLGKVTESSEFRITGLDEKICIKTDIQKLKDAWQKPLKW